MEYEYRVWLTRFVEKRLTKLPHFIVEALDKWRRTIEKRGIWAMRKVPGYHDEPLKGSREGQRSSRLNKGYRVIYEEEAPDSDRVVIIAVIEVHKHEY